MFLKTYISRYFSNSNMKENTFKCYFWHWYFFIYHEKRMKNIHEHLTSDVSVSVLEFLFCKYCFHFYWIYIVKFNSVYSMGEMKFTALLCIWEELFIMKYILCKFVIKIMQNHYQSKQHFKIWSPDVNLML